MLQDQHSLLRIFGTRCAHAAAAAAAAAAAGAAAAGAAAAAAAAAAGAGATSAVEVAADGETPVAGRLARFRECVDGRGESDRRRS